MSSRAGVGLVVGLLLLGTAWVLLSSDARVEYVDAGSMAPPFELPQLGSDAPTRLVDLRGRVVLLNFWATWCKPCEDEIPSMERLYRDLQGEPFQLLAVSVDDGPEPVDAFRKRFGLSFPLLLDPAHEVANAYQTTRFPESFLLDRDGRVVQRYIGPRRWDAPEYVQRIRELVSEAGRGVP